MFCSSVFYLFFFLLLGWFCDQMLHVDGLARLHECFYVSKSLRMVFISFFFPITTTSVEAIHIVLAQSFSLILDTCMQASSCLQVWPIRQTFWWLLYLCIWHDFDWFDIRLLSVLQIRTSSGIGFDFTLNIFILRFSNDPSENLVRLNDGFGALSFF